MSVEPTASFPEQTPTLTQIINVCTLGIELWHRDIWTLGTLTVIYNYRTHASYITAVFLLITLEDGSPHFPNYIHYLYCFLSSFKSCCHFSVDAARDLGESDWRPVLRFFF